MIGQLAQRLRALSGRQAAIDLRHERFVNRAARETRHLIHQPAPAGEMDLRCDLIVADRDRTDELIERRQIDMTKAYRQATKLDRPPRERAAQGQCANRQPNRRESDTATLGGHGNIEPAPGEQTMASRNVQNAPVNRHSQPVRLKTVRCHRTHPVKLRRPEVNAASTVGSIPTGFQLQKGISTCADLFGGRRQSRLDRGAAACDQHYEDHQKQRHPSRGDK
ncbi:hypothetical protein [Sphingomonas sp. PAMC 26621]|uniref:hypothetical protein n=1 Tax=Sphingomonas sp. PAMC 26621 TaxID=1112213 RepID=UPI001EE6380E|nr:hypothetical protein [Sphingomonas sp. PAMC 26621]